MPNKGVMTSDTHTHTNKAPRAGVQASCPYQYKAIYVGCFPTQGHLTSVAEEFQFLRGIFDMDFLKNEMKILVCAHLCEFLKALRLGGLEPGHEVSVGQKVPLTGRVTG